MYNILWLFGWVGFVGLKDVYIKHNTVIITLQIKCKWGISEIVKQTKGKKACWGTEIVIWSVVRLGLTFWKAFITSKACSLNNCELKSYLEKRQIKGTLIRQEYLN